MSFDKKFDFTAGGNFRFVLLSIGVISFESNHTYSTSAVGVAILPPVQNGVCDSPSIFTSLDTQINKYYPCLCLPNNSANDRAGRPDGVSGYHRAWYRLVPWVQVPSREYSYKFIGTFSCAQIALRKTRERELAKLDEKSTNNEIAKPYALQKLKARTLGNKGRHLGPRLVQK